MKEELIDPGSQTWEWEIKPETSWFGVGFKEIYAFKDLLLSLARKEFLGSFQQTLLGPFWVLLQPILTVLVYVLVFNGVIGVSTGNTPPLLFNLIGITLWNLFSEVFLSVTKTFTQNAPIFNKVYFPRIIVALSAVLLQLVLFSVQFLLLLVVFLYFLLTGAVEFNLSHIYLIFPAIVIVTGIGLGAGLIFAVLTAKYRDLSALVQLIVRLLMFICPVFYSLAMVPERVAWLVEVNPLSSQFELFRFAFLGHGDFTTIGIFYSLSLMLVIVWGGTLLFNKMSDRLMDVI